MSFEDWSNEDPFDDRYQDGDWGQHQWERNVAVGRRYEQEPEDTIAIPYREKVHSTPKAVLLELGIKGHHTVQFWFPKYCVTLKNNHAHVRRDFWEKKKLPEIADSLGVSKESIRFSKKPKKGDKPKRSKGMQSKQLVHLIQQGYTTVAVQFAGDGRCYNYKTNIRGLKERDLVAVPVRSNYTKIAQVVEVHDEPKIDLDSDIDYKWVIQKIDFTAFDELVKKEEELASKITSFEHQQRRQALLTSLGIASDGQLMGLTDMSVKDETLKNTAAEGGS